MNIGPIRLTAKNDSIRTTGKFEAISMSNNPNADAEKIRDLIEIEQPDIVEPTDRGAVYNQAMPTPDEEIEHPIV